MFSSFQQIFKASEKVFHVEVFLPTRVVKKISVSSKYSWRHRQECSIISPFSVVKMRETLTRENRTNVLYVYFYEWKTCLKKFVWRNFFIQRMRVLIISEQSGEILLLSGAKNATGAANTTVTARTTSARTRQINCYSAEISFIFQPCFYPNLLVSFSLRFFSSFEKNRLKKI